MLDLLHRAWGIILQLLFFWFGLVVADDVVGLVLSLGLVVVWVCFDCCWFWFCCCSVYFFSPLFRKVLSLGSRVLFSITSTLLWSSSNWDFSFSYFSFQFSMFISFVFFVSLVRFFYLFILLRLDTFLFVCFKCVCNCQVQFLSWLFSSKGTWMRHYLVTSRWK